MSGPAKHVGTSLLAMAAASPPSPRLLPHASRQPLAPRWSAGHGLHRVSFAEGTKRGDGEPGGALRGAMPPVALLLARRPPPMLGSTNPLNS